MKDEEIREQPKVYTSESKRMKVQFRKVITVEGLVSDKGTCLHIQEIGAPRGREIIVSKENLLFAEEIVPRYQEVYTSEVYRHEKRS